MRMYSGSVIVLSCFSQVTAEGTYNGFSVFLLDFGVFHVLISVFELSYQYASFMDL